MSRLVVGVQPGKLGEHRWVVVGALLGGRTGGQPGTLADRGVRVEHLALLVERELVGKRARPHERVILSGKSLDEARPPLEQLGELLDRQLPR